MDITNEQETELYAEKSIDEKFDLDIELTESELEYLKDGHCANDYNLKCFVQNHKCGKDSDCNDCWDYANKHRFD